MNETMTITLNDLRFYGYHGLYPEEKITGNEFLVDAEVTFQPAADIISEISSTINYAEIYQLIKSMMEIPTPLLETLAMEIAESIHLKFSPITQISIHIRKMHPPMANFQGNVGVRYVRSF